MYQIYKKFRKFLCKKFNWHLYENVNLPKPYKELKCKICNSRTSLISDMGSELFWQDNVSWEEKLKNDKC